MFLILLPLLSCPSTIHSILCLIKKFLLKTCPIHFFFPLFFLNNLSFFSSLYLTICCSASLLHVHISKPWILSRIRFSFFEVSLRNCAHCKCKLRPVTSKRLYIKETCKQSTNTGSVTSRDVISQFYFGGTAWKFIYIITTGGPLNRELHCYSIFFWWHRVCPFYDSPAFLGIISAVERILCLSPEKKNTAERVEKEFSMNGSHQFPLVSTGVNLSYTGNYQPHPHPPAPKKINPFCLSRNPVS